MDKIWYIEFDTACDPGHSSGDKEVKKSLILSFRPFNLYDKTS